MLTGELRHLSLSSKPDEGDVQASLCLLSDGESRKHLLNPELGRELTLTFSGAVSCTHCGRVSARSFGSGYCYPCFRTLARCDLCVMSPDRCHYHLGTCREPEWGEAFCMAGHLVYLANTSGLKVGITRAGREQGRWMDQGAVQGLPVLTATTRRDAGLAEVAIAKTMSDKTNWRKLVSGEPDPLEMIVERDRLKALGLALPGGVSWITDPAESRFSYPVIGYPQVRAQLKAGADTSHSGTLLGIKGQYLLLSSGVFNVRRFAGYHVAVNFSEPTGSAAADKGAADKGAADKGAADSSAADKVDANDQLDLF
jgi:hypothetical protein